MSEALHLLLRIIRSVRNASIKTFKFQYKIPHFFLLTEELI